MKILIFNLLCFISCARQPAQSKVYIPLDSCHFDFPSYQVKSFKDSYKRQQELIEGLKARCNCYKAIIKEINN